MQSQTRQALIDLGAEFIELGGNERIRLDQEPFAWFVETGKVEIFAIQTEISDSGSRTHVTTIESGRMLFGVRPQRQRSGPAFLRRSVKERSAALQAVGLPDTRLLRIPIKLLTELAQKPEHLPEIQTRLEGWLSDLFVKIPRSAAPNRFETLAAGSELELQAEDAARSGSSVMWLRHLSGESHFLGQPQLTVKPSSTLMPITDETWLICQESTQISCVGTEHLLRSGAVWEGLESFHDLFLGYVDLLVVAAGQEEADRLRLRQELNRGALDRTARNLAALLARDSTQLQPTLQAGREGALVDPLLSAATLVGESQGFEIVKPKGSGPQKNHGHSLARIGNASRVRHRLVILRGEWWKRDNGPLLGFIWKDGKAAPENRLKGTPVALLPTSAKSYDLVNPATAERIPITKDVADTLEGEAFMFYAPLPERAVNLWDIGKLAARGRSRDFITLGMMGVAMGVLSLLAPILTGQIFGVAVPAAERSGLAQMTLALAVAAMATFGFHLTRATAILRISGKLDGSVQAAVWDRLLALPVMFYKQFSTGDLAARSMGIDHIRTLMLGNVTTALLDAVSSGFSLLLLFYFSWQLALVAVAMVFVLMATTATVLILQMKYQRQLLEMQGNLASLVFGLLTGIQKLRGAGAEARALALWAAKFGEMRAVTLKVRHLANGQAAFNAVFAVATTMALFAAMHSLPSLALPISDFLAFSAAFGQFQAASLGLIGLMSSVLTMIPLYERLRPLIHTPPEVDEGKLEAEELSGDIELSHVSFRYDPKGPLILNDVSIRAKPGEFVALVGPSGSGKSTSLRLLLGFEKAESGSIYFDGQDLPSLNAQSVRRQIGVVLQNGQPMSGDIFNNIVGTSSLGIEEAWEAARMAGLEEDIKACPMGMHTIMSEGGGGFSGGQIQRLMIARAIVHRPRILLFDEATSALDNHTQELVSKSLQDLKATRIVVAHRLSTIRNADRIYVLEAGKVTENGTYDELIANGKTFAALAARQIA